MAFAVGFVLAVAVSGAAYASRSLTRGAAALSVVLGTATFAIGGWPAALLLLTFFVSSSLLSRVAKRSGDAGEDTYEKGSRRDSGQVLANGLVAGLFLAFIGLLPDATWPWVGFAGSLAAVTADTWATEIGAFSSGTPRLVTKLTLRVPRGTSGGVSIEGSLAALAGALLMGILAQIMLPATVSDILLLVAAGGVVGSLLDSILGATVQGMYVCGREGVQTEQHPVHRCGSPTIHSRGWRWLNNDWVNFICATTGALVACGLAALLGGLSANLG